MHHNGDDVRIIENMFSDPAEDSLSDPGLAVAAHDQEFGLQAITDLEQPGSRRLGPAIEHFHLCPDPVQGQVITDFLATVLTRPGHHDGDFFHLHQPWQCHGQGTG